MLVVEDDRDTAQLLCSLLALAGFDARSLPTSVDVAPVVLGERPAATVVSLSRSGIEAVTAVITGLRRRPEPALNDAGLVALVDDEFDLFFGLGTDADASLVRPISPERLIDAVTEAAAIGPRRRSSYSSG